MDNMNLDNLEYAEYLQEQADILDGSIPSQYRSDDYYSRNDAGEYSWM